VSDYPQVHYLTITEKQDGQRIDNVCFTYLKGVPKSRIYQMIRKGELRINRGRAKPTTRVALHDSVRIPPVITKSTPIHYQKTDTLFSVLMDSILYEDKYCLIINKPAGFAVHGGSGISTGIIEVLRKHRDNDKYLELVHRLDRPTSGCLMIAKKRSFLVTLQKNWTTDSVNKTYEFMSTKPWPFQSKTKTCNLSLNITQKEQITKVYVDEKNGKQARTIFRYLGSRPNSVWVEATLKTGRMHQIRAHALACHLGVKGDPLYVIDEYPKQDEKMLLHARSIKFVHPINQSKCDIVAPYPDYFMKALGNNKDAADGLTQKFEQIESEKQ
jgi:23S rRNA pseudouridine955/2504/2580 synthase